MRGITRGALPKVERPARPICATHLAFMGRGAQRWEVGVCLAVLVCSACTKMSPADLKTPALLWNQARGLCGRMQAVDGEGRVWREPGGCENPVDLEEVGGATAATVAALHQAFEALPLDAPNADVSVCQGNVDWFSLTTHAQTASRRTCARPTLDDLLGINEPYRSLAEMFLRLPDDRQPRFRAR